NGAITLMITVLFSSLDVPAGSLQVPSGTGADPHVGPVRRNHQRANSVQDRAIFHNVSLGIQIAEAIWRTQAPNSGLLVPDINKPHIPSGIFRRCDLRWTRVLFAKLGWDRSGESGGGSHPARVAARNGPLRPCEQESMRVRRSLIEPHGGATAERG